MTIATEELILQKTKKLLASKCHLGVSIRDLAKAAGVNVAAINYHFGSKQGLLGAVVRSGFDEIEKELEKKIDSKILPKISFKKAALIVEELFIKKKIKFSHLLDL